MYPYDLFFGLDLYDILLVAGFFSVLLYFRFWADREKFPDKLQNLYIGAAFAALLGGYGSAVLFQALYNFLGGDAFAITASTGATFYGGLIGGALIFLLVYFEGGYFMLGKGEAGKYFFKVTEITAPAIALGHGIGRIGCAFAGCCHGQITTSWFGIYNVRLGAKTLPVQLIEAAVLFGIAAFLTYRLVKKKSGNLGLYLILYAAWRFYAEYFRADDRGETFIANLSPSQLTAIVLVVVGIGFWFLEDWLVAKKEKREGEEHAS